MAQLTESGDSFLDWLGSDRRLRHGIAFTWTANRQRLFQKEYRNHLRRRRRGRRRRLASHVGSLSFVLVLLVLVAAAGVLVNRRDGFAGDDLKNVMAGGVVGAGAACITLFSLAILYARLDAVPDRAWVFTEIRVGIEKGMLWQYQHETMAIYTSVKAFVEVAVTAHFILAFVNRTSAHAFPRDALEATDEGRQVLDWFEANWPESSIGEVSDRPRSVLRRLRRSFISLLSILPWAVVLTVILLGAVAFWRIDSIGHWRPPQDLARPSAAVAPPPERRDAVEPPTLSGQDARDFLDRLRDPAAR